ncbi:MAG: HepT-like ribonuclease domain-containing protein [Bacteroidota bacterium]
MALTKNDVVRLRHMLDAARKALLFSRGKTRVDIEQDEQLMLALVRLVEIVGEAASRVSRELQDQTPSIAWADIISTRNKLIHAYFNIDLDVMWQIIQEDLPLLVNELEKVLRTEEQQRELL